MTVVARQADREQREELATPRPMATQRSIDLWDVGAVLTGSAVAMWVRAALTRSVDTPIGRSGALAMLTIGLTVAAAVVIVVSAVNSRTAVAAIPRALARTLTDPPGSWVAFVLGLVVSIPLLSVYYPMTFLDADTSRLIASIRYVQQTGDIGYFADTQEPLLPHLVYGPAVAVESLALVKAVAIASAMLLVGTTAYVVHRISSSMLAAAAAALTLMSLSALYERALNVAMYPAMLSLAVLGTWLAGSAMTRADHTWRWAVLGGACFALAPEAQPVGQLLYVIPALAMVFAPTIRQAFAGAGRMYLVIAALSVPRLLINLSEGGLHFLTTARTDFWITQGYVDEIQVKFMGYEGVDEPIPAYLRQLPWRILETLEAPGLLILGLALVGLVIGCRRRAQIFAIGALAFFVLAITVKPIPPFSRYYSQLWPGLAVLAGLGVAAIAARLSWGKAIAGTLVALLGAGAIVAGYDAMHGAEARRTIPLMAGVERLAASVDDDRGVLGVRAQQGLMTKRIDIDTWGSQFLSEDELVTYLTWPSDEAVIDLMERHGMGWILLFPDLGYEHSYNDVWLVPNHGQPARQATALAESPNFCLRFDEGWKLYQLGGCEG